MVIVEFCSSRSFCKISLTITMNKPLGEKPLSEYITDIKYTDVTKLDGEHTVQRMGEVARFGSMFGLWWGTFHSVCFWPATPAAWVMSIGGKTALFAVMGATFAGTTSVLGQATGKDRKINYFLGGCAGGALLGARSKSIIVGSQGCVAFGLLATIRKMHDEYGWTVWPEETTQRLTRPSERKS